MAHWTRKISSKCNLYFKLEFEVFVLLFVLILSICCTFSYIQLVIVLFVQVPSIHHTYFPMSNYLFKSQVFIVLFFLSPTFTLWSIWVSVVYSIVVYSIINISYIALLEFNSYSLTSCCINLKVDHISEQIYAPLNLKVNTWTASL